MERTIEGIFEVERDRVDLGGANISYLKKSITGMVIGVKDCVITPAPSASFRKNPEQIKGVTLEVESERGGGEVNFARDLSSIERRAVLNQRVNYTLSKEAYEENSVGGYIETFKHSLEVLSGNFKGETIQAEYSQ